MISDNVLEAIGHTPVIRLNKIVPAGSAEVLVKYEGVNIGGSIKTRTAYNMICEAEKAGKITKAGILTAKKAGEVEITAYSDKKKTDEITKVKLVIIS